MKPNPGDRAAALLEQLRRDVEEWRKRKRELSPQATKTGAWPEGAWI